MIGPPSPSPPLPHLLVPDHNPALSFDCAGNLFAVTGANGVGETFTQATSLLRITPATGAAVTVCTFPSTERVQVGAFATATTFVHFYGASPPKMETLTLTGQSGPCRTRYASNASNAMRQQIWDQT